MNITHDASSHTATVSEKTVAYIGTMLSLIFFYSHISRAHTLAANIQKKWIIAAYPTGCLFFFPYFEKIVYTFDTEASNFQDLFVATCDVARRARPVVLQYS